MRRSRSNKRIRVSPAEEPGHALGLSEAEAGEMEFRPQLACALERIIQDGTFTHAEIAKRAPTSRARVTGIRRGFRPTS